MFAQQQLLIGILHPLISDRHAWSTSCSQHLLLNVHWGLHAGCIADVGLRCHTKPEHIVACKMIGATVQQLSVVGPQLTLIYAWRVKNFHEHKAGSTLHASLSAFEVAILLRLMGSSYTYCD